MKLIPRPSFTQHTVHIHPDNARDRKQDSALARFDSVNKEVVELTSAFTAQDNSAADENSAAGTITLNDFQTASGSSLTGTISPERSQAVRETKVEGGTDTFQFWTTSGQHGDVLHVNQDSRRDDGSMMMTTEHYHMDAQGNLLTFERTEVEREKFR